MINNLDLFKDVLTGAVYDESAWYNVLNEAIFPAATWRQRLKHRLLLAIVRRLERANLAVLRRKPFDRDARHNGTDWPLVGYTMIGRRRLDHLQHCVESALDENLPGDFIETGVWRGGACMLIKIILKRRGVSDRDVWLADSFQGLPPPKDSADGTDLSTIEHLTVSAEQVRRNFERFELLDDRVRFLEGWFSDTLPQAPIGQLAVLRLDGDLYHSTLDALTHLYHRVVPGGYVIVDDYSSWPGCRTAVHDFLAGQNEEPKIEKIDDDGVFWRTAR